jgi:hypothetical protein
LDHFTDCNNIKFISDNTIGVRPGIGISQDVEVPLENVRRIYNYNNQETNGLLVLTVVGDEGNIYHVVNSTTTFGPILTIEGMTDFAFQPYGGRAYISPFSSFVAGDLLIEKGLEDEFVYVYAGDGTAARKAAGIAPTGNMTIANGAAGNTDPGLHIFGVVNETISGFLSAPGALETFTTSANLSVSFGSVPTSGDPSVVRRHIVASKVITGYNGNLEGYDLFFIPGGTIDDNTTTFLNNVSFFDQDLLDDASHLIDNYAEIPAGAVMGLYHERLIVAATFDDINLVLCSAAGEPEAISQITGIIGFQPDGNPITNAQELRDVLYLFKRVRTNSYVDNGDEPATWKATVVDSAMGTAVHGVATVLDTGGSSVDFLIVCTFGGISLFNGRYIDPPLTWKIESTWKAQDRTLFGQLQLVNAPVQEEILVVLPDRTMLTGNYTSGMDSKNIAWSPWTFRQGVNTVAIANIDEVIIGSDIN